MSDNDTQNCTSETDVESAAVERLDEDAATVEALLFGSDEPLTPAKIVQVAELPGIRAVREAVARLNERYEQLGSAFRIEPVAGGYQMKTLPEYHDVISRLVTARSDSRLSQAALETLAIVAYRQPILRADIEAIRGVACGEVLRGLMEKQLVKIVGRAEVLGRPMLYGTTKRFLEAFGLNRLEDLPRVEELRSGAQDEKGNKGNGSGEAADTAGQADSQAPRPAEKHDPNEADGQAPAEKHDPQQADGRDPAGEQAPRGREAGNSPEPERPAD